jgi:molecular chaperone GrpE
MRGFQQGIEDILYRQGVEPFTLGDDAFDPRRQRAFSTVHTEDPDLNKRVANRLRKGFRAGEKVIRPEIVSVYATRR